MKVENDTIEPNSLEPMYKQIVNLLRRQMNEGQLKKGDKLPTEPEMMDIYHVSRRTIRTAVDELEKSGIVRRVRGKGTFITENEDKEFTITDSRIGFTRSCQMEGKSATTEVLEKSWICPGPSDIEFLQIDKDEPIFCTKRLRKVDGVPTLIETNHYSSAFTFLENENLSGSLYEILKKHKINLGKSASTLEVCYADAYEARLLSIETGDALLLFTDKYKNQAGKPLFVSRQVYCTERLKFHL